MAVHIKIDLDEQQLQAVINDLELERPPTFTLNGTRGSTRIQGEYWPERNHVTINIHQPGYGNTALSTLTRKIKETVLHELRHAWQREKLSPEELEEWRLGSYRNRREERDANDWSVKNISKYPGLVKIKRQTSGRSGFGRFADAEQRVR